MPLPSILDPWLLLEGFLGMIDDVKLWSRVLSTKDVQSLYSH